MFSKITKQSSTFKIPKLEEARERTELAINQMAQLIVELEDNLWHSSTRWVEEERGEWGYLIEESISKGQSYAQREMKAEDNALIHMFIKRELKDKGFKCYTQWLSEGKDGYTARVTVRWDKEDVK